MWSPGDKAWFALGIGIVAYELLGSELLSVAYDRYVDRFPVLARVLPIILTAHVINAIPQRFDPVHQGAKAAVSLWGKCFD